MKKINSWLFLLLCIAFTLGSCTKTGPVGPDGAQGEQGPAGPKGDPGPKGEPGAEGSAVVISSGWISVSFEKTDNAWAATLTDDAITQAMIDKAEIDVFIRKKDNVYALNYFKVDDFYITMEVLVGKINIHSSFDASSCRFRYVIIPSGAPANARVAGPDHGDYRAFCKYYGIAE